MERISTGIMAMDDILDGGFPKGSTILITGRPGSGKTIFAHQMMYQIATQEQKVIYLTTLAEPQVKVLKFQQEFNFFDAGKFQNSVIYQDLGSTLRKYGPSRALVMIDQLLKKHEPGLMVIDTIKTISDISPSFIEFQEFVLELSLRLATWNCTALLLGEYSEEDIEIRPESAIADGIVHLSGTEEKKKQKRFLRILKMRGTGYSGGEMAFQITGAGIELFPRLNPVVSRQVYIDYQERISTGIPGFDKMMGGGLPRSSTTLLSGASGTGKTLVALHFIYNGLQAGENGVYVSFEENPRQLISNAWSLGLNLEPYITWGNFHILHISPIELDTDMHIFELQKLVQETGAQRLVIDSISSFEIGMADKVKYTDNIWALTDFFKTRGVSVFLTNEQHDSDHISKLTKHGISFLADNLLLLSYQEQKMELKRYLRVVKMRGCSHTTLMQELLIEKNGLALGESPHMS